ncbi:hypothetical protein VTN77DRAFT_381 [Rasamsonia byssochlamydoides]|uniref:uncharacterized protein n=1 Tax=Rasamsonia byssochlamydoides TaxID=89139 RepID=UPI003741EC89
MRVSSSHLTLSCLHFKKMLQGNWREKHTLLSDGRVSIPVEDWPDAMLILMNIIHGHTRKVPRTVSLEMLAKVAVLVDYYQCFEVVEVFSEMWINQLKGDLPKTYSRDVILWICISRVFLQPELFQESTTIALRQSQGPIQTLGLPISGKIVDRIDRRRQESIDRIVTFLHGLLDDFCEGRNLQNPCSFECQSILLGALTKEMSRLHLLSPRPAAPFLGFSFAATANSVRKIRSPIWCCNNRNYYSSHCQSHHCSLEPVIRPIIDSLEDSMKGLSLEDFD